jgi:sec-independent protein translocase protein TatC
MGPAPAAAVFGRRDRGREVPVVTTMSFLEHLEELRSRLIVCVVAALICMAIAWPLVPVVQRYITRPLQEPPITQKWSYHLETWGVQKFPDLARKLGLKPEAPKVTPHRLNYMAPLEPFFVQMKIAMITGLALAFPVILYQLWLFFAPALYPKEKQIIYYFLPIGTLAFILGDFFFLKLVWPLIIAFSLRYESAFLFSMLNLTQFVNFCLRLLLLFGLIFELPLILLVLARVGLVRLDFLRRQRRVAILLSAVVAAFHADLLTMAAIAIPLYAMYELSILTVRLFGGPYSRGQDIEATTEVAEPGLGPPPAA